MYYCIYYTHTWNRGERTPLRLETFQKYPQHPLKDLKNTNACCIFSLIEEKRINTPGKKVIYYILVFT